MPGSRRFPPPRTAEEHAQPAQIDFLPGLFFKTEYRYSTFNSANFPVLTAAGGPSPFAINSTTSKCLA
jgi:hypothetical protein